MNERNEPDDLSPLVSLVHHRWSIPIIAELHRRRGAKFVTLVNSLDIGRASLAASLEDLIALGLVARNTGHGHPMRPEYLLTERGAAIGPQCERLVDTVERHGETDLAFRKWTLPLVAAIGGTPRRFNEIRSLLKPATPRALTLGLKTLLANRWADRSIIDAYPPAAAYELKDRGLDILRCVPRLDQDAPRAAS